MRAVLEVVAASIGFALGGTVGVGTVAFAFGIGPAVELAFAGSPAWGSRHRSAWRPRVRSRVMKGLVCAGGEATRLGELTRVANKHLLPVGRWPMIYYPLQLLERAGVESVLVVTGKGHAGQMIDLLGDGRLAARGTEEPLLSLDVTYKVQTQPGGIAQVVGMARDFAQDDHLVVVLGDNIFERSQAAAIGAWAAGGDRALIFVKDVPDPENFGVVVYDEAGRSPTSSRRRASWTCATTRRPRTRPSSASTASRRTSST